MGSGADMEVKIGEETNGSGQVMEIFEDGTHVIKRPKPSGDPIKKQDIH